VIGKKKQEKEQLYEADTTGRRTPGNAGIGVLETRTRQKVSGNAEENFFKKKTRKGDKTSLSGGGGQRSKIHKEKAPAERTTTGTLAGCVKGRHACPGGSWRWTIKRGKGGLL